MKKETIQQQQEPKRIELSKETKARNQRFDLFEKFYKDAESIFYKYKDRGEREKYFQALYNLAVCPGSRMGGRESRVVEFFWGNRLFDKNEGLNAEGRQHVRFESESGATMFFFKNDNGYVSIQLSPAFTEQRRPIEDFIFWRLSVDPARLLEKSFQDRCWRAFMAYMEVTSLDGHPTFAQRAHVWYLRHFKNVIIEKKETPIKAIAFIKKVGTWVMTVGFSGLVIFLLQMWLQPNPAEHENIQDIRGAVKNVEQTIEHLQQDVLLIKSNQDSIIMNQKAFQLENTINKKQK